MVAIGKSKFPNSNSYYRWNAMGKKQKKYAFGKYIFFSAPCGVVARQSLDKQVL